MSTQVCFELMSSALHENKTTDVKKNCFIILIKI